jgi:hypothetical protein
MKQIRPKVLCIALAVAAVVACTRAPHSAGAAAAEKPGPLTDPGFFPIGVWLQNPSNAARYRAAGINTYVALWRGPTDEQIQQLKAADMRLVCSQNETGLRHKDDPTILAWMHGDEPDNAQAKRGGGYGPPVPPEKIVEDYARIKKADPSRPVLLNLGQGVAWDGWIGRGVRTRHPEDYPEYVKGSDIASFDIYPAVHDHPDVAGKLWYVANGVSRLKEWAGPTRQVWNCIEASRIDNVKTKPTPAQVKAEVWMSLVHGSRGLIYFVHQFKPQFSEASLLQDEELLKAVTAINAQVRELAPALNSTPPAEAPSAASNDPEAPVAVTSRKHAGATYVFAVAMRPRGCEPTITIPGVKTATAEVLGESRTVPVRGGKLTDRFDPYGVHLYRLRTGR